MKITVDDAGRLVVPKALRERLDPVGGTEVEKGSSGRICDSAGSVPPSLVRKKGVLVYHGDAPVDLDCAAFIRSQRDLRLDAAIEQLAPSPDTLDAIDDVVGLRTERRAGSAEP